MMFEGWHLQRLLLPGASQEKDQQRLRPWPSAVFRTLSSAKVSGSSARPRGSK